MFVEMRRMVPKVEHPVAPEHEADYKWLEMVDCMEI